MNILTKEQFCEKYKLSSDQFEGKEWIKTNLTIREEFLPVGFNPKMTGILHIPNLKIVPIWFNPVIKYHLSLPSVESFDPTFNPVVGGWIKLSSLIKIPFGWKPTVGGDLILRSITTLPEWFEPTALRVRFNGGKEYTEKFRPEHDFYSWRNGNYIKVNEIMGEVVCQNDFVYHIKRFGIYKMSYLVTDGSGTYVCGNTLMEAQEGVCFTLFCKKYGLTKKQFFGEEWIYRDITIYEVQLPIGFNPKVWGTLDLPSLEIVPIWFNPVVKNHLRLPSVISFHHSFTPVVGDGLYLESLMEIPYGWKPSALLLNLPLMKILPDWFEPVAWKVWINKYFDSIDKFKNKWEAFRTGLRVFQD